MIKVGFPDGNEIKYDDGITPYEIAKKISPALAREILSAEYNGKTIELRTQLFKDGNIKFFITYMWSYNHIISSFFLCGF